MNAAVNPLPGTGEMQEPDAPRTDGVFVNSPDARQAVLEAMDEHDRIDAERAECNAEKQEVRARLKAQVPGINLKAFDAALKRRRMEEGEKAEAFDETLRMCLRAISPQADMFGGEGVH